MVIMSSAASVHNVRRSTSGDCASYLTPLDKKVPTSTDKISSIKAGLVLCGHKLPLSSQLVSVLHRADGVVLKDTTMIYTPCSN